jgi:hypothetical protein
VRASQLQTGNARTIRVLAWSVRVSEKAALGRLRRDHVNGEWHRLSPSLLAFAATLEWLDTELHRTLCEQLRVEQEGQRRD